MKKPEYITSIKRLTELTPEEHVELAPVAAKFVFRSNSYYQQLIDWDDPDDPIRRIIIPLGGELENWGRLDASDEVSYTVVPGLEHKYSDTALLLANDACGGYCRFCFRKRLFMEDNDEVVRDISQGLEYIRQHPEISNVLLTGGDPLKEPAGHRNHGGHGQHERGGHPLRRLLGDAQRVHQPRDSVDHDGLVEDHHERGQHQQPHHGRDAARLLGRSFLACSCHGSTSLGS